MTTSSAATPTVHLPAHIAAEIVAHARVGKPEEICGIVRGRGLQALEVVRGRNIAEERIENYEVDPETLLRQFDFEDAGDEMMGIYHSHPVSEAYPSATDAWNAHYPDSIYFICSLEDDEAPIIRAFRMTTHFLGAESQGLVGDISFYETRPGLFAYYQAADKPLPPCARLQDRWRVAAVLHRLFHASGFDTGPRNACSDDPRISNSLELIARTRSTVSGFTHMHTG